MIEIEGLVKRYRGVTALAGIDLEVHAGEVFGFLGPNGAGKSTMTKILCGLIRPTEGRATIAGYDVTTDRRHIKPLLGFLPERAPVYRAMTSREYLALFGRLYGLRGRELGERIESSLERVRLNDVDGRKVGTFSKGMTQRLGIARSLLHDPQIVFFDEPASGLDPTGRREIREIIQQLARTDRTVFLCSHDLAEVQATCNRVGFIRKGELVKVEQVGAYESELREFDVELDAAPGGLVEAVRAVDRVRDATIEADGRLHVVADPVVTRAEIARLVQSSGALHLAVNELTPSLETLYASYIEQDSDLPPPPGDGDAPSGRRRRSRR